MRTQRYGKTNTIAETVHASANILAGRGEPGLMLCRQIAKRDSHKYTLFVYHDCTVWGMRFSDGSEIEATTKGYTSNLADVTEQWPGIEVRAERAPT